MEQGRSTGALQPEGLRERIQRPDSTGGRDALTATGEAEIKDAAGKDKKTFGRTPDGTGKANLLLLLLPPSKASVSEKYILAIIIPWRHTLGLSWSLVAIVLWWSFSR